MPGLLQPPPAGGPADAVISGGGSGVEIQPQAPKSPAIGIDLGTSFSSVAVWKDREVHLVPFDNGNLSMRSCVAFTTVCRYFGDTAFNQAEANSENTVYNIKRLVGRLHSDVDVQKDLAFWTTKVTSGDGGKPLVFVKYRGKTRTFTVEEISAMMLIKLKTVAETYLGCAVHNVVITVPSKFGLTQRQATKNACVIAGLNVLQVLNESTATAITYAHSLKPIEAAAGNVTQSQSDPNLRTHISNYTLIPLWKGWKFPQKKTEKPERHVLMFDLGGTWLDVSVVSLREGIWKVISASGESHLGGEDFDNRMVNYYVTDYYKKHGKDFSTDGRSMRRLRSACERAKCVVSSTEEITPMSLEAFFENTSYQTIFSNNNFEQINKDLFKRCKSIVKTCVEDAGIPFDSVSEIVLVGGSSNIPQIRRMLTYVLSNAQFCDNINPQAVSYGAALQAAVLNGDAQELSLVDVTTTSLSIGVSVHSGSYKVDLPKYSAIPAKGTRKLLSTLSDNQSSIVFTILEGDSLKDGTIVGEYELHGIPQAPKGVPEIVVHLNIDQSGLLYMYGDINITGIKSTGPITCIGANEEDIEKMVLEAQQWLAEDEEYIKRGKARAALEECAANLLSEHIDSENRQAISTAVALVLDWVKQPALLEVGQYDEKKRWLLEYNQFETVIENRIGRSKHTLIGHPVTLLVGIGLGLVAASMFHIIDIGF